MIVKVLYFAAFRETAGVASESLELDEGATVETLKQQIQKRHPELKDLWAFAIVTVNRKYTHATEALREGDEVGILPPISGG